MPRDPTTVVHRFDHSSAELRGVGIGLAQKCPGDKSPTPFVVSLPLPHLGEGFYAEAEVRVPKSLGPRFEQLTSAFFRCRISDIRVSAHTTRIPGSSLELAFLASTGLFDHPAAQDQRSPHTPFEVKQSLLRTGVIPRSLKFEGRTVRPTPAQVSLTIPFQVRRSGVWERTNLLPTEGQLYLFEDPAPILRMHYQGNPFDGSGILERLTDGRWLTWSGNCGFEPPYSTH